MYVYCTVLVRLGRLPGWRAGSVGERNGSTTGSVCFRVRRNHNDKNDNDNNDNNSVYRSCTRTIHCPTTSRNLGRAKEVS